ncbi:pickpocket protein 28-like [Daphnia pulicaria]|uniref:pickpocket protein 28-like n=1 Tax=Daphnia pulicaria TaxID=35523 RepID=UPI001EEB13C6|nr:pickpocket protein 28-like [Daphnia pulicaria]
MPRLRARINKRSSERNQRLLQHFCENTSIHGLKHIFEDGSLFFERVIWSLVFLSGICFSGYFCLQMWQKWEQSPLLTSVETHLYPLKNIPFPAVTICNVNKVSGRKLNDAISGNPKFKGVSYAKLQTTLRYMTKLDRAFNNEEELLKLSRYYEALNITALDLFKVLKRTAPSCTDLVLDCSWLGLSEPCMQYFTFLPTDDGMCCTFNGGKYFDTILDLETKAHEPLKVNGNGYRMGLSLVLDADLNDCSVTSGKFDGFKVLIHSPEEFPDVAHRGFVIGLGTETFVGVKATTSFYSEEVAKEIPASIRQCHVEGEKKLKYFQRYSRSACSVECDTQFMEERCHCRPFYFKGDNQTKLCEIKSYGCIAEVYEGIHLRGDICGEECNCLPPCTDTWYEPEISYASFPGRGFNRTRTFNRIVARHRLDTGSETKEYLKSNVAMLHVYYKEKTGMRYRTDIRYGIEDFISAMGGLLGLGLGMSFISVIELFYFLFYRRIFLWLRTNWSTHKKAPENQTMVIAPQHSYRTSSKSRKSPPSSPTINPSSSNIWFLSLDGHSQLVRRGSTNLPSQIQGRVFKY